LERLLDGLGPGVTAAQLDVLQVQAPQGLGRAKARDPTTVAPCTL
jgi:hypothetical protein